MTMNLLERHVKLRCKVMGHEIAALGQRIHRLRETNRRFRRVIEIQSARIKELEGMVHSLEEEKVGLHRVNDSLHRNIERLAAGSEPVKQPNPCAKCGAHLWDDPRPCWNCKRQDVIITPEVSHDEARG